MNMMPCWTENISWKGVFIFFLLTLFSKIPSVFASDFYDCCPPVLQVSTPESHPLMAHLPNIHIDSRFEAPRVPWPRVQERSEQDPQAIQDRPDQTEPIPIIKNSAVTRQINLFQTAYRKQISKGLERAGKYLTLMQDILITFNLPIDLAYLPLIESNFSVHAVSRAKAVGPWQFMKGTGGKYGLRIDSWIDERRDPEKSTRAAAAYLKDLYGLFGSWLLSLASYNAGENRIIRAMAQTKAFDFWELRASGALSQETQHFVPKFMAARMIAKSPESYGFPTPNYHSPLRYDEVIIKRQTSLRVIARAMNIPLEEIEALNPELRRGVTPPNYPNYPLKLPLNTKEVFVANQSKMAAPHKHQIKKGETISSIARRYRVPMQEIMKVNRLHKKSIIRAGYSLIIPQV